MEYPYAKFSSFNFSRFGFVMRTTNTHTHRITDADDRYTHTTTVGVGNYPVLPGVWLDLVTGGVSRSS